MRIIIAILICAVSTLTFTACNDQQYFSNEEIAKINIDEKMEKLEELYDTIGGFAASMGIDLNMPDLSEYREWTPPEEIDYGNFTLLPLDIFKIEKPGRNKHTGKLYYLETVIDQEIIYQNDDGSFFIRTMLIDDDGEWQFLEVLVPADTEEWSDDLLLAYVTLFIEYVGFSDNEIIRNHYGIYIRHALMD